MKRYTRLLYTQLGKELEKATKDKRNITYRQKPIRFERKDETGSITIKGTIGTEYSFIINE